MGLDDPATNRQAQPDAAAAVRPGRRPAVELLEHPFVRARRQTRPVVGDTDLDRRARLSGRDLDRTAGRRVPGRVLQQVHQHLFDQEPVHRDERQVGRDVDPDRPVAQVAGRPVDRRPDDLLQDVPLPVRARPPRLRGGSCRAGCPPAGPAAATRPRSSAAAPRRSAGSPAGRRAGCSPPRPWRPAGSAGRATRSSAASCGAARPRPAAGPVGASSTDWSRSTARAIRLAHVSSSRRCSGSRNRCGSSGRTPSAPTVRCEPASGTNRAVAFGSVSVPSPATWSWSATHWATTAFTGDLGHLGPLAEAQLDRLARPRGRTRRPRRRRSRGAAGRRSGPGTRSRPPR